MPGYGDVWTWTAIDAETKLVPSFLVGERNIEHAIVFMKDLASRLNNRVQLTTYGLKFYMEAVGLALHGDIDYAMLMKRYGTEPGGSGRYSPAVCLGCDKKEIRGNPEQEHISASFVVQQNLTMRMRMRRFTRLTNAFSKKIENLEYSVALHFMHYNFVRRHQTLKMSPAIAAGVDPRLWSLEELVGLMD